MTVRHELTFSSLLFFFFCFRSFCEIRGRQQECPVPAIPHQADTGLPRPSQAECQGCRPILVDRFGKSFFSSFHKIHDNLFVGSSLTSLSRLTLLPNLTSTRFRSSRTLSSSRMSMISDLMSLSSYVPLRCAWESNVDFIFATAL